MTRKTLCLALTLCIALLAVVANAQDEEKKKRKKRQRRGPGLNRVVIIGGGGGASLVVHPKVATDLKLTDEQKEKLTAAVRKANSASRLRNAGDLTQQERRKKFRELAAKSQKARAELTKLVKETLNEEQTKRFEQIQLQTRGTSALFDKKVAAQLKLTEDQQKKMREAQQESREKSRALSQKLRGQEIDIREYSTERNKVVRETNKKVAAVLTSEQQEAFKKLKGKILDLGFRRGTIRRGTLQLRRGGQKKGKKAKKRDDL